MWSSLIFSSIFPIFQAFSINPVNIMLLQEHKPFFLLLLTFFYLLSNEDPMSLFCGSIQKTCFSILRLIEFFFSSFCRTFHLLPWRFIWSTLLIPNFLSCWHRSSKRLSLMSLNEAYALIFRHFFQTFLLIFLLP